MHLTLFKQFFALLLIPYFLSYIKALQGIRPQGVIFTILSVVPYVQLVIGIESVYSTGYENALRILIDSFSFQGPMFPYLPVKDQQVFYACYTYMFRAFLLADFMLFSVSLMTCAISGTCSIKDVGGFFFKSKKAPVRPVLYLLALMLFLIFVIGLILGKNCYINNIVLMGIGSVVIAVLISMIAFVGAAGKIERQSIHGLMNLVRFGGRVAYDDYDDEPETDSKPAADEVEVVVPEPEHIQANPEELNRLRAELDVKLKEVVEAEKMFLNRDLTMTAVADRLGVFRDELSDLIDYK